VILFFGRQFGPLPPHGPEAQQRLENTRSRNGQNMEGLTAFSFPTHGLCADPWASDWPWLSRLGSFNVPLNHPPNQQDNIA